ncbi:hypothetical protein H4R24_004816 [Coemansia sp. RSA 988]|nr:hypothetical protein H4R24_004816 [Coemansia sp. RSA 988]
MFTLAAIRVQTVGRVAIRSLSASSVAKKELYLKEIRSYKPDASAAKADVSTKEFAAPKAPEAPKNDIDLKSDLKTYEQAGVLTQ